MLAMSAPPTVAHSIPPTPVKAMMMPMKKPERFENQRLTSMGGARYTHDVRPKPMTNANAKNCQSACTKDNPTKQAAKVAMLAVMMIRQSMRLNSLPKGVRTKIMLMEKAARK